MPVLRRLARFVGLALVALLVVVASAVAVRFATAPPSPSLPPGFSVAPDAEASDPVLRAELLRRSALDQAVRHAADLGALSDVASVGGLWGVAGEAIRLERVDRPNRRWVRETVAAGGWPTSAEVGRDGLEALFTLVQHADLELQQAALPPFRAAWQRGALDGEQLALLTDRVLMGEGRPQRYGSQLRATPGTGMALYPIDDAAAVDARRAAMGMVPLAEYLDLACRETGACVDLPS